MTEESIIRRKLLLDGDGTGDDKKIQNILKQLAKWINNDMSTIESNQIFDSLLAQLYDIEFNGKKSDLIVQRNAAQMSKYLTMQTTFEKKIHEIKTAISNQEDLLKKAKIFKKNHVDYDLLAQTLSEQPCRRTMNEKIALLRNEVAELVKEKENLDKQWNLRIKQCHVLSTSANKLKGILKGGNRKDATESPDDLRTMVVEEEIF